MSETPVYVLNKRVQLLQTAAGFRTSLDSVFLASTCKAKPGDHILDLGCGIGSAGLCVLWRVPDAHLTGVEIQAESYELARQNAALNNMAGQSTFVLSDIRNFKGRGFDHIICNPPYLEAGTHHTSPSESLALARGHQDKETTLQDWLNAAHKALKQGGGFTMIHRADHTDKIVQGLGSRFGAIEIIPLWPRTGIPAKRVIIRAIKGRKSGAILHPGLILHEENGDYTAAAEAILRNGAPL
ncbi:MAG: methyltransferase [Alphaproteobacteria bacterium]|nr:methyltransferase [Alphaproteobacteria bacterium]